MRKRFILILAVVLVATFACGPFADGLWRSPYKPVIMCVTLSGAIYHGPGKGDGSINCEAEGCFIMDLCQTSSIVYNCCYRYKNAECSCLCWAIYRCE